MNVKGRTETIKHFIWRSPSGTLPQLSLIFLINLLACPALTFCSTQTFPEPLPEKMDPEAPPAVPDSIHISVKAACKVEKLEIFIYNDAYPRRLIYHFRAESDGLIAVPEPDGDALAVGVANLPGIINEASVRDYESIEQMQLLFSDDSGPLPVMSGISFLQKSGEETGVRVLELKVLRAEVVVGEICNEMEGEKVAQSPRVRLRNVPCTAEVFRERDFHPSETFSTGWTYLRSDIGLNPVNAGLHLRAFPNGGISPLDAMPCVVLDMSFEADGRTRLVSVPVPELERGESRRIDLCIK